jgi:hypothetical protein
VNRTSVFAVALATAVAVPSLAAQTVVTPSDPQGWGIFPSGTPTPYGALSGVFPHLGNGSAEILLYDEGTSTLQYWYEFSSSPLLSSLSSLSWDWYVSSSSTTPAFATPALGMYVEGTAIGDGYLIWEGAYNGTSPTAPQDQWVSSDLIGDNFWWDRTGGTGACAHAASYQTISWFISECFGGQGTVLGFSPFLGNGYDGTQFHGAFDNFAFSFDGGPSGHFNFETDGATVPEPATMTLLATGLMGLAATRRKRRGAR